MKEKPQHARRAPSVKIEVDATADLIDRAIKRDSHNCFVAEAIKMAFPIATNVTVDLQAIRLTDPETRLRYLFFTPRVCQLALIAFDQGIMPEPFQFTLTKPMRITRGRGPAKEETPEQKIEKRRERQRKHKAAQNILRATRIDEPFAPPIEATHEVKKAMDDPFAPLGPPIALNGAGTGAGGAVEVIVGGAPPRHPRGRNPGTNIVKQRRFGAHDLIE